MSGGKYTGVRVIDGPRVMFGHDEACSMLFSLRRGIACLILSLSFFVYNAYAQSPPVTTSIVGTTGTGNLGTQVLPPSGNVYGIQGGTTKGGNLFHSFSQFNVGAGDLAQFQTSNLSPNTSVGNILSRVTGGPSSIFGGIDSATYYPNANFFFMNPAGILFGPNATVSIGGMAHFTTADYLRLDELGGPNAGIFHADPTRASVLTMAPVSAFGFLGPNPAAAIEIQGSQLTLATGKGLSLVGGNITIGADPETGSTSTILAPGGQINIASVASPGEVLFPSLSTGANINGQSFTTMGTVSLTGGSVLDVSDYALEAGGAAGSIRIRGGQFVMDSSVMLANTLGDVDGANPGISIAMQDDVILTNLSGIATQTFVTGRSGDIEITARNVEVSGGSIILTQGVGEGQTGQAGDITLVASNSILITGTDEFGQPSNVMSASVFSTPDSQGDTGSILLRAPSITVDQGGLVFTAAQAIGRAGDITLDATNVNILGGGAIQTSGAGSNTSSGNITVNATDTVTISGQLNPDALSKISNRIDGDNLGTHGNVSINAKNILLSDQGQIRSENFGQGGGGSGNVTLTADESIILQSDARIVTKANFTSVGGINLSAPTITVDHATIFARTVNEFQGGAITLNGHSLTISNGSEILSSTEQATGQGGAILLTASDSVNVSGGSIIKSSSEAFSEGPAGPIAVTAGNTVSISGSGTGLFSEALGTGNGGSITVAARQVQIADGAVISARSTASGSAGSVTIEGTASPAQSVLIDGAGSGIFTDTKGTGLGGSITVNSNAVSMTNGAAISANSAGGADAGSIDIIANNGLSMQNSSITTEAGQGAGGGNIKITTSPQATVYLQNSQVNASVADGPGGGGNVSIDPQYVILQNSQILATAADGQGGSISITTGLFLPDAYSVVNADSGSGLNGTVTIQSPISQAGGKIQPLGKSPLLSTAMFNQRCAALAGGTFSSFTVAGRESLPAAPGSWLSTPLALSVPQPESATKEADSMTADGTPLLSLRQISPTGFLTQVFAVGSSGCQS